MTNPPHPESFDSLSAEARHQRAIAHDKCATYNRSPGKGNFKKVRELFGSFGENLIIERGFHCDYGKYINFGTNVYININCTMLDGGHILIGNDCLIGPNVQLLTINHPLPPEERLQKTNIAKDIVIGDNVWIGAGCIILPGANVGSNSVIGAGSVVSGGLEANSLYLGNPARRVRSLTKNTNQSNL